MPTLSCIRPGRLRALAVSVLVAIALARPVPVAARPATADAGAPGPRLVFPGGHPVRAGQWVYLRWERTGRVSELEILLSRDGGRTYTECVTPELDPDRQHLLWRVPDLDARELRLRIRFNRDGREIEAPPASPVRLAADADGGPEPLVLPVAPAPEPAPRPDGARGGATAGRPSPGPFETRDEAVASAPGCGPAVLLRSPARTPVTGAAARAGVDGTTLPRSTPLRP